MFRSMKYSLLSPNLSAIFFAVLITFSIGFFPSMGFSQDSTIHIQGGTLAPQNPLLSTPRLVMRSLMRPPILEGKMLVDARSFPI